MVDGCACRACYYHRSGQALRTVVMKILKIRSSGVQQVHLAVCFHDILQGVVPVKCFRNSII